MVVEAERVKPRAMYVEEAIALALQSRWSEALAVNRALVERHGSDEDSFNRIGKALTELGKLSEALESYSQALQLNPLNPIAQKNTRKLSMMLEDPDGVGGASGSIDVDLFSEEPGKSALTTLKAPAGGTGVKVSPGDLVDLDIEANTIGARTSRGVSLGQVDTKIARRLIPLMQSGNRYSAVVARIDPDDKIEIVIRETHQSPDNLRKSSFPVSRGSKAGDFRPYAKESLLGGRSSNPDIEYDDDDDDDLDAPIADDPVAAADDDLAPAAAAVTGDDVEVDLSEAEEEDDDDDDDSRPEDSY
jgi:tetratricopeptide (TPR) repeat protein